MVRVGLHLLRTLVAATITAATLAPNAATAEQHDQRNIRGLTDDLRAVDPLVRARAACALRDAGDAAEAALPQLVATLAVGAPVDGEACGQQWMRGGIDNRTTPGELAAAALAALGSLALQPVLTAIKGDAWIARRNAAWILGALDDVRAVNALIEATRDREARVREQAAWALGAIDDADAVPALMALLKDADPKPRRQAAWALGAIEDPRAIDALIAALSDESAGVREQAAWALGVLGDSRALTGLITALKDSNAGVRRQAAWAIGVVGR